MAAWADCCIPALVVDIETAGEHLVNIPHAKCDVVKADLTVVAFKVKQVVVPMARLAPEEDPSARVGVAHRETEPLGVELLHL